MTRTTSWSLRRVLASTGLAALAVLVVLPAAAAAPGNDMLAAALTITGERGSITASNVDATVEAGEPDHGSGDSGSSVWFRWTAPSSTPMLFETCGSPFDTLLAAYTGSGVGGLTRIASSDDACRGASRIVFLAAAGSTYSIAVGGYEGESGSFVLRWQPITPPANDAFLAAQALSGPGGQAEATTIGAGVEAGESGHAGVSGASVWFTWTAPGDGVARFDTCASEVDTGLAVYTGEAPTALNAIASNDDACGTRSRVQFVARRATTYRIAVASGRDPGTIVLAWTFANRPTNDDAANARRLRGEHGSLSTTNAGSSGEGPLRHQASVWFRWRAPRTFGVTFDTCAGASFDTVITVYRGESLRRAVRIDENDDACVDVASRVTFRATRGTNYFVVVDGLGGAWGTFILNWRRVDRSTGQCFVPDVRGLTLREARLRLERADCSLGRVVRSSSRIVPRGRIIAQYPFPNAELRVFARVNVEVSSG